VTLRASTGPFASISSSEWGLPSPSEEGRLRVRELLGVSYEDLETRARNAVYEFVARTYDDEHGGAHHYYRADLRELSEKDAGNYLIALNFLAMYDRYGDEAMLARAEGCFRWAYENRTETHPMMTWQGGVRDEFRPTELYTKYTADALTTCLALWHRTGNDDYDLPARQFHNFLKQARAAGFKSKLDLTSYRWLDRGFCWNGFGGPTIAYLQYYGLTERESFLEHARAWADHGLMQQAPDGGFYLIDNAFWNSDLTALELRALVFLFEETGDERYLNAAVRFADWLLRQQREDGSWPIGIDRDGEVCAPNVGPGDMPHIAISLVRLHRAAGDDRYLSSAVAAVRYGLRMQAIEEGAYPLHLDDPYVRFGFWSWEPLYDFSLSGDQVVHHVRGIALVSDYVASLVT